MKTKLRKVVSVSRKRSIVSLRMSFYCLLKIHNTLPFLSLCSLLLFGCLYKKALHLAEAQLLPTDPVRLGLALNYSVCFQEIFNDKKRACELAKSAFEQAISQLDDLPEESYKDSTLIMQVPHFRPLPFCTFALFFT